jgi:hypothetical protein
MLHKSRGHAFHCETLNQPFFPKPHHFTARRAPADCRGPGAKNGSFHSEKVIGFQLISSFSEPCSEVSFCSWDTDITGAAGKLHQHNERSIFSKHRSWQLFTVKVRSGISTWGLLTKTGAAPAIV